MGRKRLTEEGFDDTKMGINPYLKGMVIHVKEVWKDVDVFEGKEDDGIGVRVDNKRTEQRKHYAEQQEFVKVFRIAEHRKALASLAARAKELLCWLLFTIKPGKDYVVMNISLYKKENGCSHSTYTRAVEDLMSVGIIAPTRSQVVFWVSPLFMFNGNRLTKYPDNVVIVNKRSSVIKSIERVDELK